MPILAVAIVPGGNIQKTLCTLRQETFAQGDSSKGRALPEGLYLGFYTNETKNASQLKNKLLLYRKGIARIVKLLPTELRFEKVERKAGKYYLQATQSIPVNALSELNTLAQGMGLFPIKMPPLMLGEGFFLSTTVPVPHCPALNFRHYEVVLYSIVSEDTHFSCAHWEILERTRKLVGPLKKKM